MKWAPQFIIIYHQSLLILRFINSVRLAPQLRQSLSSRSLIVWTSIRLRLASPIAIFLLGFDLNYDLAKDIV
jgi:hypothetical protein